MVMNCGLSATYFDCSYIHLVDFLEYPDDNFQRLCMVSLKKNSFTK